jgi:hypothetical protein
MRINGPTFHSRGRKRKVRRGERKEERGRRSEEKRARAMESGRVIGSVADPGCLSEVPDPNFFDPGSRI